MSIALIDYGAGNLHVGKKGARRRRRPRARARDTCGARQRPWRDRSRRRSFRFDALDRPGLDRCHPRCHRRRPPAPRHLPWDAVAVRQERRGSRLPGARSPRRPLLSAERGIIRGRGAEDSPRRLECPEPPARRVHRRRRCRRRAGVFHAQLCGASPPATPSP